MRVAVVGSGVAGVAAAHALLEGGVVVDLLDFGNEMEQSAEHLAVRLRKGPPSQEDLALLRASVVGTGRIQGVGHLLASFLGRAPIFDLMGKRRLGSNFTYRDIDWGIPVEGATVMRSLARGGLSNIWGAACYPLTKDEYRGWPFEESDIAHHYAAVAKLLSLIQPEDDLASAYTIYHSASPGLPLNAPAQALLEHWNRHRAALLELGSLFGRARLAVRAETTADRMGCQLCGLCLHGCPYDAIYRADWTLEAIEKHASFRYRKGLWVHSFQEENECVVVKAVDVRKDQAESIDYDALFLAAGTLSSLRIAADAQRHYGRQIRLLDNDVYLVPFICTVGGEGKDNSFHFSLNELALRIPVAGYPLHIQFYCMNDQLIDRLHPLLAALPGFLARRAETLLARMVLAVVYLPGQASADIRATVRPGAPVGTVSVTVQRSAESAKIVRQLIRYMARARRVFGLRPIGPILRSTPTGCSGGHVVGSLRMTSAPRPLESFCDGRLLGTKRVYVVDGAALPQLPAQNPTYTIMANAHRIAAEFAEQVVGPIQVHTSHERPTVSEEGAAEARFGRPGVWPLLLELDHHQLQYEGFGLKIAYHRYILNQAVKEATLQPGMHILDYGCGRQELRKALPPGVHYTGYDLNPALTDVPDPRGRTYDCVFALQLLMCLDGPGIAAWAEACAQMSGELVVMVPARNFFKDEVLDRLLGLRKHRIRTVQSLPTEIYGHLSHYFVQLSARKPLWMGELTRWRRLDG